MITQQKGRSVLGVHNMLLLNSILSVCHVYYTSYEYLNLTTLKMIYSIYLNTCQNIIYSFSPIVRNRYMVLLIMNYHITNVIYVITSNSLGQMQTRMDFFSTILRLFYKEFANKRKSNDLTFK